MALRSIGTGFLRWTRLADDPKPALQASDNGSELYTLDTGAVEVWDGTAWWPLKESSGGGSVVMQVENSAYVSNPQRAGVGAWPREVLRFDLINNFTGLAVRCYPGATPVATWVRVCLNAEDATAAIRDLLADLDTPMPNVRRIRLVPQATAWEIIRNFEFDTTVPLRSIYLDSDSLVATSVNVELDWGTIQ